MAFNRNGLALLGDRAAIGTGKGSTKRAWAYFSTDALTAIETAGYFNDLAGEGVADGDILLVSAAVGAAGRAGQLYVLNVSATTVTLVAFEDATA